MKPAPPVLRQFLQLATLAFQPSRQEEWSLEKKFAVAKEAGFDAVGGWSGDGLVKLCQEHDLGLVCYIDVNGTNFEERLVLAKQSRAARVNVQLCDHDTPPADACEVWLKVLAAAEKLGLEIDLEVHRDTATETPEKTYEIAERFEKATGKTIRFCWDFSHFAVVKHINPPYAPRMLTHPGLIQNARQMHFRPFNGHHCQIPVTNGKGEEAPEFKPYVEFIDALLACWMEGAKGGEVLYICPEILPIDGNYGLSIFPNIWEDTIPMKAKIDALWAKHLSIWKEQHQG